MANKPFTRQKIYDLFLIRPHRLVVRTGGSQPPNGSSILPGAVFCLQKVVSF